MVPRELRVLNAECPICEHYGPHLPSGDEGTYTCGLCNTSFGTGDPRDESVWLGDEPD